MKPKSTRKRLDVLLVEKGLADSQEKARAMILAGEVRLDGQRADKSGMAVSEDAQIELSRRSLKYASRGGLKLEGALEDFSVSPAMMACLDIGSSNGGFTDCLLQRGARRVYAVDVNTDQLDWKLKKEARVIAIKKNARELDARDLPEPAELVVMDLSFISVTKAIRPAVGLAMPGATFLILVKPQFELKREEVPTGGIVEDTSFHQRAVQIVREHAESCGLECLGVKPSRLAGAEGNQEYFLHARKKGLE